MPTIYHLQTNSNPNYSKVLFRMSFFFIKMLYNVSSYNLC
uniref:Uncharacterized protein n=1 Tax=Setaria italica TaxID=4555 RepID=K4ANP0_SETIT